MSEYIMPYGKHVGKKLSDVPADYLRRMISSYEEDIERFTHELERREMLEAAETPMAERIIKMGYRQMAKLMHPDLGGDPEEFKDLRAAMTLLEEVMRLMKDRGI